MYKLHNSQMVMYFGDKQGAGQAALLCGSTIIPEKLSIEKLQHAANEVYRINSCLRSCFVEKEDGVYMDIKPYEERTFEVKHFKNKKELDK